MIETPIPYARQWIHPEDVAAVTRVLTEDFLTTGPRVEAFEKDLCRLTGAAHAVACANGTAALHLACLALGVDENDVGITSPLSFLASANCIEYCGGVTDFLDIDPETLCLNPDLLDAYCKRNKAPKVVIPVDFAGHSADLGRFHELSQKYGFALIEDAAHAIGSSYKYKDGEYACGSCTHTDLAIFSFHPAKTITAGEGGAVLTNDSKLAQGLRRFRNHGMAKEFSPGDKNDGPWYYEMENLGFNYRITDIQCALVASQLKRLPSFAQKRRDIVKTYNRAFEGNHDFITPPKDLETHACPHLYPLQFTGGEKIRKKAFLRLKEDGIFCQVHYIPIHLQPYYKNKYGYGPKKCPQAEDFYAKSLSLPLFPSLSMEQVEFIINRVMATQK